MAHRCRAGRLSSTSPIKQVSNSARRRQIIKAVRELDNRVTVPDVVAKTGLSFNEVTQELNTVAANSQANLDVTASGEVFYSFPQNFEVGYYAQGAKRRLLRVWKATFKSLYFIFRISFGITLISSFIFIFGTILLFQSLIAAGMGASQEVGAMWAEFASLVRRVLIRNHLSWRKGDAPNAVSTDASKKGFLMDCYSFLFGEGNPNEHLQDDRWKLLAQVIRLNEGIVIAEHLPPYTGRPANDEPALFKVLSKFNGYPEISDSGQLIYVFPNMQQRSTTDTYTFIPALVEEKPWLFSQMTREELRPVLALAVGNFLGSLFFWWLCLYTHRVSQPPLIFLFFAVYGVLFVLVPLVRLAVIRVLNFGINRRNATIRSFERLIGTPDGEIKSKLEDAEKIRQTFSPATNDSVVYTTQRDYLEQLTDNLRSDFQT